MKAKASLLQEKPQVTPIHQGAVPNSPLSRAALDTGKMPTAPQGQ